LATTLTLATVINCIGIGFQRGTHTRWQLVANDGTGAPTLTDMGASFSVATGGVLTLYIAAPPNGSSVWVRVVDEVSGAVFEQEITGDLPADTQFLSPRLFMNNGATAAAIAYDCSGVTPDHIQHTRNRCRCWNRVLVHKDRHKLKIRRKRGQNQPAGSRQSPPLRHMVRTHVIPPGNRIDRRTLNKRLGKNPGLQGLRPMPLSLGPGDQINLTENLY
jgi:hypothetical protein